MYLKTMARIWVIFTCFKRRHSDKSPLVWIGNYLYRKDKHSQLTELLENYSVSLDEYPVEHTHSIAQRVSQITDEPSVVTSTLKNVFANKEAQANFRETFGHVKNYIFGRNQLKKMKLKAARYLLKILPMLVTIHNVLYQVTHLEIGTFLRAAPILSQRLLTAKFAMPYLSKRHQRESSATGREGKRSSSSTKQRL